MSDTAAKIRTAQQRKAIEVYCSLLAQALDDGGFSIETVLAQSAVDRNWTQAGVKDLLFKPIMQAMTGKTSTTKLEPKEVSEIYEVLNRHTSNLFGVGIQFPSHEG